MTNTILSDNDEKSNRRFRRLNDSGDAVSIFRTLISVLEFSRKFENWLIAHFTSNFYKLIIKNVKRKTLQTELS
jgi:hypothetical protein